MIACFALMPMSCVDGQPCITTDSCQKCKADGRGCAFWVCEEKLVATNVSLCLNTTEKKPTTPCTYGGEWVKLQADKDCPSNSSITTTTTPHTTTTTSHTTPATTSTGPDTTTTSITTNSPDIKSKRPNYAAIFSILATSLLVLAIIIFVAYRKVRKLYRTQVPYQSLHD